MTNWPSAGTVRDVPSERNLRLLRKRGGEVQRDLEEILKKGLPPTGKVGGVLKGELPNPEFAVPQATKAELENETVARKEADSTEKTERIAGDKNKVGPIFNVKTDYGAVGNGVTDDTSAIQSALNAAKELGGGAVYLPPGTYIVSGVEAYDNTTVFGTGWASILKVIKTATNPYPIRNANFTKGNKNITFRDFAIDGNKAETPGERGDSGNPSALAIFLANEGQCENCHFERLYVHDSKHLGIVCISVKGGSCIDCVVENNGRDGITLISNTQDFIIQGCLVRGVGDDNIGLNGQPAAGTKKTLKNIVIDGCLLLGPGSEAPTPAITVRGGEQIQISNTIIREVGGWGIGIFDAYETNAQNIDIENVSITSVGSSELFYAQAGIVLGAGVIKTEKGGYGLIENVRIADCTIRSPTKEGVLLKAEKGAYGTMQHIVLDNVRVVSATTGVSVGNSFMQDIVLRDVSTLSCTNGISVTGSSNLRTWVVDPLVFATNTGNGILIEGQTNGVLHGAVVEQEGKSGQTGIKLKSLAGTWQIANNYSKGATTDFNYTEIGSPSIVESFFDKTPIAKPTVSGERAANPAVASALTGLSELGLLKDSSTAGTAPATAASVTTEKEEREKAEKEFVKGPGTTFAGSGLFAGAGKFAEAGATASDVAIFSGTTGKVIEDGGITVTQIKRQGPQFISSLVSTDHKENFGSLEVAAETDVEVTHELGAEPKGVQVTGMLNENLNFSVYPKTKNATKFTLRNNSTKKLTVYWRVIT